MLEGLTDTLISRAGTRTRFLVAIAGPPASGKSTLAQNLGGSLRARGESAAVIPMDGFHYDDAVLNAKGWRSHKGAPFTFDVAGFHHLLQRLRSGQADVAIPVFDRALELSRGSAEIVPGETRFLLVEGNYLLLNEKPWHGLRTLFDISLFVQVAEEELLRRLHNRWSSYGFDAARTTAWISGNDLPNIRYVLENSGQPDLSLSDQGTGPPR